MQKIKDIIKPAIEKIDARCANPDLISGIPSGFHKLDDITDGFQKEYYVIGARTSMGKSALVKDFILNGAKTGKHIHLVNVEDSNINTVTRLFASMSGVELWKMKKGRLGQEEYSLILHNAGLLAELPITFEDSAMTQDKVKQSCQEAVDAGADMLVIDFLQLIRGTGTKKRLEQLQDISQLLKWYSKKLPVLAVVQINRNVELRKDRRPTMSDIRECGDIEQDADVIILLYRDSYYTKDAGDATAELIIAKGKNCGTGVVHLYFDELKTSFYEGLL